MPARTCRALEIYPGLCCRGACVEPAGHEITLEDGSTHLRCDEHLRWSEATQAISTTRTIAPTKKAK